MQKGAPWENAGQMAVPFNHQPTSKTDWTNQEADEDGFAMQMSHVGNGNAFPATSYAPAGTESVVGGGPRARETVRSIDADPDPYNTDSAAFAPPRATVGRTLAQDSDAVRAEQQQQQQLADSAYAAAHDEREAFGPQQQTPSSYLAPTSEPSSGGGINSTAIWVAVLCLVVAVLIGAFIAVSAASYGKQRQPQRATAPAATFFL